MKKSEPSLRFKIATENWEFEAIHRLNAAGMAAIVVTNQAGLARGYFSADVLRATNEALKSRDVIEPLQKQGIDMLGGTPQEFADYIRSETAKWTRVVAAAGMKQ